MSGGENARRVRNRRPAPRPIFPFKCNTSAHARPRLTFSDGERLKSNSAILFRLFYMTNKLELEAETWIHPVQGCGAGGGGGESYIFRTTDGWMDGESINNDRGKSYTVKTHNTKS